MAPPPLSVLALVCLVSALGTEALVLPEILRLVPPCHPRRFGDQRWWQTQGLGSPVSPVW